ncbi:MAG: 2-amino-4-hydroxy-6-hydroxymethyldihydropteridine diphosphokinase [Treponema sp.]|nr:2-amino-4-hydroxy-6-hydroxymethyldihydropteridine diphosphokinase [Treponema sp.]
MNGGEVVLGIGSNRADSRGRNPRSIIEAAVRELERILRGLRRAAVRETEPLHVVDQPPFLNTAVSGFYGGNPRELLRDIGAIEARYGRDRSRERRWGERTLDIDILLFGDLVIREHDLEIPHPRLAERVFALEPLLDLLPEARDPESGGFFRDMLEKIMPAEGARARAPAPWHE